MAEEPVKLFYKVIANYPGSHLQIGEIVSEDYGRQSYDPPNNFHLYPAIFCRVPWWESLTPEEMPKYLKSKTTERIYRVKEYFQKTCRIEGGYQLYYEECEPATEADYKNQHQQALNFKKWHYNKLKRI